MKRIVFAFFSIISFFCIFLMFLSAINRDIILSAPNMSGWVLENDEFVIVPIVDETVTFYVEDKQKRRIFNCEKKWRSWDFKYLGIDADSTITITTGDMGNEYYYYNGETWFLKE